MRGDHLSHRISINETGEEHEGHEVVVEDLGVEVEVGRDEGPGKEEGKKTDESVAGFVAFCATRFDYI
jgi:hypothetical protein